MDLWFIVLTLCGCMRFLVFVKDVLYNQDVALESNK
jgi:hypothetical protein